MDICYASAMYTMKLSEGVQIYLEFFKTIFVYLKLVINMLEIT